MSQVRCAAVQDRARTRSAERDLAGDRFARSSSTASTRMAENRRGALSLMRRSADARVASDRINAEAGSFGAWPPRTAHRGPASAEGEQTSREESGLTSRRGRSSATLFRAAHATRAGEVADGPGFKNAGSQADWFGNRMRNPAAPRRRTDASMTAAIARHIG